jgi:hypothetical protein
MSARFKVEQMMKDRHWPAFRAILAHPRTTVDIAHRWLLDRHYTISRNAVWNYWNASKEMIGSLEFESEPDARRQAIDSVKILRGVNLITVASFAVLMANASRGKTGTIRRPI